MAEVNIKRKVKLDGKWQFFPVLKENGKIRLDKIVVKGVPKQCKDGVFYIEWREDGKRRQVPAGRNPREALDAMRTMHVHLNSSDKEAHPAPVLPSEKKAKGTLLTTAYTTFLKRTQATRTPATYRDYRQATDWLEDVFKKQYVEDVTKSDLVQLFALGRQQALSQNTINKRLIVFLRAIREAGSTVKMGKGEWPKVVSKTVYTYALEELSRLYEACEPRERVMYQTFLQTGFRRREVTTLTWPDIGNRAIQVKAKPDLNFHPKNYEERAVPVPRKLIESIQALPRTHRLVFPSLPHWRRSDLPGGAEDSQVLIHLKEAALKAGLNCGMCHDKHGHSCATHPVCEAWFLHKFRHTYATQMLESGVHIRRLQLLLGHKQLSTTEKYLRSIGVQGMDEQIENSSLAKLL